MLTGDNNYYSYYGSAIDSLNHIHVLYGAEGFKIVSNTGNGGSWETSVIDNVDYLATSTDFSQTVSRLVIDANDNMFVLAASIDPSTYAATSYYYYGKFAGSNTWMKGKNDIPELNNMIGKDLDWLHPFVPSTGNLMLQYFEKIQVRQVMFMENKLTFCFFQFKRRCKFEQCIGAKHYNRSGSGYNVSSEDCNHRGK